MGRKINPALIGGFLLGATVLAVAGLVIFGGGKFFQSRQYWEAYFDESIKGLAIGAPVTFRGVNVGTVTDIKVVVDPQTIQIRTPVTFEVIAERITDSRGEKVQFTSKRMDARTLFERGLRARLETQSFVTGQLAINLDFYPGEPMTLRGGRGIYPEMPTIPSAMQALRQGLEDLNLAEIAKEVQTTLQGVSRLINGPEMKEALLSGTAALKRIDGFMTNANSRLTLLGPVIDRTSANTNEALEAIQALVRNIDSQTVPAMTETVKDVGALARRVDAETVPAANQALTDVHSVVDEIQKTAAVARGALEQAQKTLAAVETTVDDRSPLQYEIRGALKEVSSAARAVRVLTNYLERHPDALLFGKSGK